MRAGCLDELELYLSALFGRDPDRMIEIAHQVERDGSRGPMNRGRLGRFRPADDLQSVAKEILDLAGRQHVWVGVAPRRPDPKTGELGGRKVNVAPARVLWVDCDLKDSPDAGDRLRSFQPAPHMVVHSGGGYHAYWLLDQAISDPQVLCAANRNLATRVGGDPQAADAARILRPAGTRNYKSRYRSPRDVRLLHCAPEQTVALSQLVDPEILSTQLVASRDRTGSPDDRSRDPLQRITPPEYFLELTGLEPGSDGKVCCPLPRHEDPGPSCHVYPDAARGWYCFGCGVGGDIYELAGGLWGLRREGAEFLELRELLLRQFGAASGQPGRRARLR